MTESEMPVVVYRAPWWRRAWTVAVAAWVVVSCVLWSVPWPVAGVLGTIGAAIAWRTLRVAVLAYPDRLVVRNLWRTERFSRSAVDGIGIGGSTTSPLTRALVVSTRHGRLVSADALTSVLPGRYGLGRARRAADRLTDWLAGD